MAASEMRFRKTRDKDAEFLRENAKKEGVVQHETGLQYKVIKAQKDESLPTPSMTTPCSIHYRGRLVDGSEFDSSYKRGAPMTCCPGDVVPGWTQAMKLMRAGDRWQVYIPADLGYGERGAGAAIPGGAALIFDMEMVEVGVKTGFGSMFGGSVITILFALVVVIAAYLSWGTGDGVIVAKAVKLAEAISPSNPRVFFEVTVGNATAERIEFELFSNIVPKTAENFRALSTGEKGIGKSGKPLHYKGSKIHRVTKGFVCQGGDITGTDGGESIYGSFFEDEWTNGVIAHEDAFLLSKANDNSQFFITLGALRWLDNKHVVFGRVVTGQDVVKKMEATGTKGGTPSESVEITDSGEVK